MCPVSFRHSLPEDAGKYFDKESRVLEAPMTIQVADQVCVGHFLGTWGTLGDLSTTPQKAGPWWVPAA